MPAAALPALDVKPAARDGQPLAKPPELIDAGGTVIDPREVSEQLEDATAQEAIGWALETFHPNLYFACSFQKTSSVTIDMADQIDPETQLLLPRHRLLFPETYARATALAARYGIEFERYARHHPSTSRPSALRRPALEARA